MKRASPRQKAEIIRRSQGYCDYCLSSMHYSPDTFSAEHIIPSSRGGKTEVDNLALSCQGCNNIKYKRVSGLDPVTGQTVPLYNPRQDKWVEHFTWSNDLTLLLGLTPTGRATVELMQLNRTGVVNLRQLLLLAHKHPAMVLMRES
ncbi:MAG TPA: HNH endonuclease signature motif containing protein [Ktedonobacteraceae bacterium]